MAELIDISTHQLSEQVLASFNGKVSLDAVMRVWHAVGTLIKVQMTSKRGVRLDKFGIFSFGKVGEPVFNVAQDFAAMFRLTQNVIPLKDNVSAAPMNLTQLSSLSGIDRALADKIYSRFIGCIGKCAQSGRNVLVSLNKVGEINITARVVKFVFMGEFVDALNSGVPMVVKVATKSKTAEAGWNAKNYKPEDPKEVRKAAAAAAAEAKKAEVLSRPRQRNPMTGEYDTPLAVTKPPARARNPIMGDDVSSVGSPRRPSSAQGSVTSNHSRISTSHSARGLSALSHSNLAVHDARAVAVSALGSEQIVDKLRQRIVARGGSTGIRGVAKVLSIMDDNGDKRLSKDELKFGLRDYGVTLTPVELEQVFAAIDRDRNGFVDITEFLVALKGDLNPRRKKMIRMAFDILDRDGSGEVTVDDLVGVYDVSQHTDVVTGKKTETEALQEFMSQWDRLDADGIVTYEEFEDYYKEVSASIDGDDYFELMIRNAWRIAGGEGQAANTANKRVLVTNKDGSQRVVAIEKELGMRQGDKDEMMRRLAKQGVVADSIELHGGMDTMSKPKKSRANVAAGGKVTGGGPPKRGPPVPANKAPISERHAAAAKLATVFKGMQARKMVGGLKRVVAAKQRQEAEDRLEAAVPRPPQLSRPKGKSYIGF